MKQFLSLLLACGALLPAHADDPVVVMNVKTGSGVTPIKVTTQSKITFSNDQTAMIVAVDSETQSQSFDVADISNITFTLNSTSIVNETLDDLKITNKGKVLTISGDDAIDYAVWNVSGVSVMSGKASGTVSIDFNSIQSGVYIIKANNKTIKYSNH